MGTCDEALDGSPWLQPKITSRASSSPTGKSLVVFKRLAYKRTCSFLVFMGLMLQSALRRIHFFACWEYFLAFQPSGVSLGLSQRWIPLAEDVNSSSRSSLGTVICTVLGPRGPGTTRVGCSAALELQHSTLCLKKCHLYQLRAFRALFLHNSCPFLFPESCVSEWLDKSSKTFGTKLDLYPTEGRKMS